MKRDEFPLRSFFQLDGEVDGTSMRYAESGGPAPPTTGETALVFRWLGGVGWEQFTMSAQ